jgi:SagB-type dehydrogenase family enzyme
VSDRAYSEHATAGFAPVRAYHEATKHVAGLATATRRVDRNLVPKQYKRYPGLPGLPLPAPADCSRTFFETLAPAGSVAAVCQLPALAAVLRYSAGILRRRQIKGRSLEFRAASCSGGLYHLEVYAVVGPGTTLEPGAYHFDVPASCLRLIRPGDWRGFLAAACGRGRAAGVSLVITSTFWRNAWRYQERAWRHAFWDTGTMLANLLAVAEAHDLQPALQTRFVDAEVNALLDVDAVREAAIAVVGLGSHEPVATAALAAPPPLGLPVDALSRFEIEYPSIWRTHAATSLPDRETLRSQRAASPAAHSYPSALEGSDGGSIEAVIRRRGSSRRLQGDPMRASSFQALLAAATAPVARAQWSTPPILTYVIATRVEGVEPGAYYLDGSTMQMLRRGDFSGQAAHMALDQAAAGEAAFNVYFVAGLDDLARIGPRAYRDAQLAAGIRIGRLYLALTQLGHRGTALTFYDDEVASFFDLDAENAAILLLAAVG